MRPLFKKLLKLLKKCYITIINYSYLKKLKFFLKQYFKMQT